MFLVIPSTYLFPSDNRSTSFLGPDKWLRRLSAASLQILPLWQQESFCRSAVLVAVPLPLPPMKEEWNHFNVVLMKTKTIHHTNTVYSCRIHCLLYYSTALENVPDTEALTLILVQKWIYCEWKQILVPVFSCPGSFESECRVLLY